MYKWHLPKCDILDEANKALILGTKFKFGGTRVSVININSILMQYLKKSKLMPQIYDKWNIIILNKERINLSDFFISISKMPRQQYDQPKDLSCYIWEFEKSTFENSQNNMIFIQIFGCCEVSFLKRQIC